MSNTSAQVDKEFLLNEFEYFIVADSMDFMVSGKLKIKTCTYQSEKGKTQRRGSSHYHQNR